MRYAPLLTSLLVAGHAATTLSQNQPRPAAAETGIGWPDGTSLDFGALPDRGHYTDSLRLTNTGPAPFLIENVRSTCGCTVADWPAKPIAPGDTIALVVEFNCKRSGEVRRYLDVWIGGRRGRERLEVWADCPGL